MYGLNIHLSSFRLNQNLIQPNDKIRVSVTTMPEKNKEAFIIESQKLNSAHHFFTVNITDKTEKIIFVFRRKSFIHNDPIIASTSILANQFPSKNSSNNTEVQTFRIYEPKNNNINISDADRKVFGQMQIQFGLTHPFLNFGFQNSGNKQCFSNVNTVSNIVNENNNNNFIFIDSGITN